MEISLTPASTIPTIYVYKDGGVYTSTSSHYTTVSFDLPNHNINIELTNTGNYANIINPKFNVNEVALHSIYGAVGGSAAYIGSYAFYSTQITTANYPQVSVIHTTAFYNCKQLSVASFASATKIDYSGFASCSSLQTVYFPKLVTVGIYAFSNCKKLTEADFPKVTTISSYAFYGCTTLSMVNTPICTSIGSSAFYGCSKLLSLYINSDTHDSPIFLGTNAFYSTPFSNYYDSLGRYGSIFVPSHLYSAYLSATNWAAYSSRIVSA